MSFRRGKLLILFLLILFSSYAYSSELMALQGKALYQDELINSGNVTVIMYDHVTAGTLIYNETFVNKIQNGFFDVVLGNSTPLNMIYGKRFITNL